MQKNQKIGSIGAMEGHRTVVTPRPREHFLNVGMPTLLFTHLGELRMGFRGFVGFCRVANRILRRRGGRGGGALFGDLND